MKSDVRFPGESPEYRKARDRLVEAEVEARRAIERAAAVRRELPPGGVVPEDYVFEEAGADGGAKQVRLSVLFARGADTLIVYSFMYGPEMEQACPSCTSILDSLDGAAPHLTQRVNLAVVAKSPLPRILAHAEERGWRHLRLLSSAANTYNRDCRGETPDGSQMPMLNVFTRREGEIRHSWGSEEGPPEEGQEPRNLDLIWPLWSLFDLAPAGRGADLDFPKLSYES